jgi:hypothetical protein
MKLTSKSASATHRVLVYGGPKTGKTQLVAQLAQHYNLIWFDCEQGWATLLKLPKEWQERINIVSVPDSRTYPIAAETWLKVIKGQTVNICEQHGKVACAICKRDNLVQESVTLNMTPANTVVVFDSLTQFTNSLISHITKAQPDEYKLQLDDYGNLRVLVDKFLSQVQAAQYNIVCITHEEEVEMEDGKNRLVPSSGSSKSSRNTAKYFDDVVYCEVKNRKHVFGSSTGYGMNMVTGSRTGVVMEGSVEPSLLDIFTSWKDPSFNLNTSEENQNVAEMLELPATEKQLLLAEIARNQETVRLAQKLNANQISATREPVEIRPILNAQAAAQYEAQSKIHIETRTPGQIALDNLRARQLTALTEPNQ